MAHGRWQSNERFSHLPYAISIQDAFFSILLVAARLLAAELLEPLDRLPDDVVGGGGAGGESNGERARARQPVAPDLFLARDGRRHPDGPVADFRFRHEALRLGDVEGRHALRAN